MRAGTITGHVSAGRQECRFLALIGIAACLSGTGGAAQQPVQTTTTGILIDATVVDRKGQPVLDLRPEEFELTEDGVRQQILSVTLVNGAAVRAVIAGPPAAEAAAATTAQAVPHGATVVDARPSVTAILFDRLSAEARPLARRAALAYVATLSSKHDYAGVFLADLSLVTFQPFTNDIEKLRVGIDRFAATSPTTTTAERTGSGRIQSVPLDVNRAPTAGAEFGTPSPANAREREALLNALPPEGILRRMELRMFEGYQQFLAEFDSHASLAGLTAVVDALALLPGRKSVFYFTEQLPITDRLKPRFDSVIARANRSNITFYPVDAVGLRIHSKESELGRNVDTAGGQGLGDVKREDGPWTKELERQEQMLVSRPAAVLGRLAKDTGGFMLDNTNDLAAGMTRMQQERLTYYVLSYQTTNTKVDNKFRRVNVKVKRSQTTVKARPGYTMQ